MQEDDDIEQDESENSSPIEKRQRLSTRIKTTLRLALLSLTSVKVYFQDDSALP